ncbi:hypothetical protein JQX13_26190 [Archangium violaceum]|uniref:hypothetical protein n=1 Tax=Archangium violaceum TaxID=83451 RepID=UPI00193C31A0|nr:hypothetical protein [Archangium violaceum]QRK13213.1 hypothetical protein JQX13_26190 [Archangium violaceum]
MSFDDSESFPLRILAAARSTAVDSQRLSQKLASLGLNCSENTPEKMAGYISQFKAQLSRGSKGSANKHILARTAQTARRYEYTVSDDQNLIHKLLVIITNHDLVTRHGLHAVDYYEMSRDFRASEVGSILRSLIDGALFLATFVSKGKQGSIDGEQITAWYDDTLQSLEDSSSSDFDWNRSDTFVAIHRNTEHPERIDQISACKFSFSTSVKDFRNKEVNSHESHLHARQWSVTFEDLDVLNTVYNQVECARTDSKSPLPYEPAVHVTGQAHPVGKSRVHGKT